MTEEIKVEDEVEPLIQSTDNLEVVMEEQRTEEDFKED